MKHYKLDKWLIYPESQRGIKNGKEVKLEPKMLEVLLCLIEHKGQTVSKPYLMETVWKDIIVTEHSLNKTISKLRKVFGDTPKDPKVIETISKKGYRLLVPVEEINESKPLQAEDSHNNTLINKRNSRSLIWYIGILLIASFFIFIMYEKIEFPLTKKSNNKLFITKVSPFTSTIGLELMPAFSSENNDLSYVQFRDFNEVSNIYIKKLHDNKKIQLTKGKGKDVWPSFSPDGRHIAYYKRNEDSISVYIASINEFNESKLITIKTQSPQGLHWSPDGKAIVYTEKANNSDANALFILNIDDRKTYQVTFPEANIAGDENPVFSPNGKQIAFIRRNTHEIETVGIIKLEGDYSSETLILDEIELHHTHGLCWTKGGDGIMYFTNEGGSYVLKIKQLDGLEEEMVFTATSAFAKFPCLSSDGKYLSFVQWEVKQNIYNAKIKNNKISASEIIIESTRTDGHAELISGKKEILFSSNRSGEFELWVYGNEKKLKQITKLKQAHEITARCSSDGKKIVYSVLENNLQPVFLMELPNGLPEKIADNGVLPSFSRDNEWVYFNNTSALFNGIQKISLKDRKIQNVVGQNAYESFEGLNGQYIYFTKEKEKGIWCIDGNKEVRKIIDDFDGHHKSNWNVRREGIYFVKYIEGQPFLFLHKYNNRETIKVGALAKKGLHIDGIFISEEEIYYTIIDQTQSDIMLVEFE